MTDQLPEVTLTPEQEARAALLNDFITLAGWWRRAAGLIVHLQDRVKQLEDENIMRFDQARHFAELAAGRAQPPDDALLTAARKLASYNAWNGSLHDGRKLTYVLHDDITALRAALPTETTEGGRDG